MSEIGIIGQMYEDRRTKKSGKLVERDEKYKTLLMESSDGKTFNVSFGGFKSNWRKLDTPVETVEEAMQEVEVPTEPVNVIVDVADESAEPSVKVEPVKKEKVVKTIKDFEDVFINFASTSLNGEFNFSFNYNKSYAYLKHGKTKLVDFAYRCRDNTFWILLPSIMYTECVITVDVSDITNHPEYRRDLSFKVSADDIQSVLNSFRDAIIKLISENVKEED